MSWWAAWAGFLLLLCWAVGARERLRGLRQALEAAFAALDDRLQRQLAWIRDCLPPQADDAALQAPHADAAPAACHRLHHAGAQLAQALAVARGRPVDPAAMGGLTAACRALHQAWLEVCADGRGPDGMPLPPRLQRQHEQLRDQVLSSCAAFNHAAQAYNEAIGQFPALLLAWGLRLRRVGVLEPMAWGA